MSKQFKVEKRNGKFVVMVTEPINRPFWKFWEPKTKTSIAKKKDGNQCVYEKEHYAKSTAKILSGTV